MTNEMFDNAINGIRADLIEEAAHIMPKAEHKPVYKYAAVAAVLAVSVIGGIATVYDMGTPSKSPLVSDNNSESTPYDGGQTSSESIDEKTYPHEENSIVVNHVDSAPEMLLPFLGEKNLTAMSREEMSEYYGVDLTSMLSSVAPDYHEINGHAPHGIYSFEDGVFDVNGFVYSSEDGSREIEIYIGKTTKLEQFVGNLNTDDWVKSTVKGTEMYICQLEIQSDDCIYAVFKSDGCSFIVRSYHVGETEFISTLEKMVGML